ncbi:hypothetical protein CANCADRAFT_73105 [Tortispora caseinolytica NRRL Y-17796]|uniref:Uncharacterized protein n=1 Tax=Tortispora caseinolytica NRRL Y-17796 TaxID=767744 RepID=A0A1E4TIT2_9ASCO|nr:hypothetical protein CANCADRAFT_73105 [Tortispora caseinolytica NRRL Y-17796]
MDEDDELTLAPLTRPNSNKSGIFVPVSAKIAFSNRKLKQNIKFNSVLWPITETSSDHFDLNVNQTRTQIRNIPAPAKKTEKLNTKNLPTTNTNTSANLPAKSKTTPAIAIEPTPAISHRTTRVPRSKSITNTNTDSENNHPVASNNFRKPAKKRITADLGPCKPATESFDIKTPPPTSPPTASTPKVPLSNMSLSIGNIQPIPKTYSLRNRSKLRKLPAHTFD